jgi:DNA-directed RNA polymerase subunit RPC12/RpoP
MGCIRKGRIIRSVSQTESSNRLVPDDAYYHEDWRLYYAKRRCILRRFGQFAAAAAFIGLLFAVLPESFQVRHLLLMNTTGAVGAFFLLATATQWFMFNWTLGGWTCPRCREPFFHSTLVRNPFGTRCRHCNLRRLKKSEVGPVSFD